MDLVKILSDKYMKAELPETRRYFRYILRPSSP